MLQIVSDIDLSHDKGFLFLLNQCNLTPNEVKFCDLSHLPNEGIALVVGDPALRLLTNHFSCSDVHCYVLPSRFPSLTVVPIFSYKDIYSAPEKKPWMIFGINKAKALLQGATDKTPTLIINPTTQDVYDYLQKCYNNRLCVVDIEKTIKTNELTAIGFAADERSAICIPKSLLESDPVVRMAIAGILKDKDITKVFHNYIFDCMFLEHLGYKIQGTIDDTMLRAHCLNPELPKSLSDLARMYLYCEPWKEKHNWDIVTDDFQRYNARDCVRTFQIWKAQWKELEERNLKDFYYEHYVELFHPVLEMCTRGIKVDPYAFAALQLSVGSKLEELKRELVVEAGKWLKNKTEFRQRKGKRKEGVVYYRLIDEEVKDVRNPRCFQEINSESLDRLEKGKLSLYPTGVYEKTVEAVDFNPNSHTQLKEILKSMGFKIPTKRGRETTDTEALLKLQMKNNVPFIEKMMEYGKLATIQENYCNMRLDSDRLKFSVGIGGTKSGRFNSSETPWNTGRNIQNVPSGRKGIDVKQIFIPDLGKQLVQVDLSQAELRVVAWLSKDKTLIDELESNDVHQYTADEISKVVGFEVPRAAGKFTNHGTSYGMRARRFQSQLLAQTGVTVTLEQAQAILDTKDKIFPGIKQWQKDTTDFVVKNKYLTTPMGRTRHFFGRIYSNYEDRELDPGFVNEALNYVPQSTVADVINKAWLNLISLRKNFQVLQQCHDSILVQCPLQLTKDEISKVVDQAFGSIWIEVHGVKRRIPWDISFGMNWRDLDG